MMKGGKYNRGFTQSLKGGIASHKHPKDATPPFSRGFTLVELIVSVAMFTVVMVIAVGSLLSISAAERKAETLKSVMNNLNFSLESMSRTIRTGYDYGCPTAGTNCHPTSGGPQISFTASEPGLPVYTYCLSAAGSGSSCNTGTSCATGNCSILRRKVGGPNPEPFTPFTSPEVRITNLTFYMVGAAEGDADNTQPKVTISISGLVQVNQNQTSPFNLQTTVTQRLYDQ